MLKLFYLVLLPCNILLDKHLHAKVGDFGFAKAVPSTVHGKSHFSVAECCGSPGYTAPELVHGELSTKADVYSMGIISWITLLYICVTSLH